MESTLRCVSKTLQSSYFDISKPMQIILFRSRVGAGDVNIVADQVVYDLLAGASV